MKWQPVSAAPTDGREVLAAFPKQFGGWVVFIAHCTKHHGVYASNHAKPTVFAEIEYPEESFMGIKLVTNDAIPAGEIHAISDGKCVAKVVGVDCDKETTMRLYKYQHEETGNTTVSNIAPDTFTAENPRWYEIPFGIVPTKEAS